MRSSGESHGLQNVNILHSPVEKKKKKKEDDENGRACGVAPWAL